MRTTEKISKMKQGLVEGFILPSVIIFIVVAGILAAAVLSVVMNNFFVVGNNIQSQQSFNIAEAGVNYYLWHIAHSGTDYKDGTGAPAAPDPTLGYGPYTHQYIGSDATNQGTFTLWVKPQGGGSTIVTVRSIGKAKDSAITRTVDAKIGAASFASYGLVSDVDFWFGNNESANGPVFSNQGVHMDGPNSDTVGSANASYTPSPGYYNAGDGGVHTGVWCSSSVVSPNCATRDKSNWLYPQPSVDFNQVSASLCTMKKVAFANDPATQALATQSNACTQTPTTRTAAYVPRNGTGFSASVGYLIQLNTNGTYNLSKVNAENDRNTPYTAALTLQTVATGIALPSSGVIFVEDNVWVLSNPTFTGRVTIGSGRLASTSQTTDVNIAGNMLYATKDGSTAIGLVAEGDVIVAPYAPPASGSFNFEVDAAVLSQSGAVTYPKYYKTSTSRCTRGWTNANQTFTFYGSVATRQHWTWNIQWGNSACGDAAYDATIHSYISGVERTATDYDYNLLYAPPPSYPVTGGYNILSWREVLTKP